MHSPQENRTALTKKSRTGKSITVHASSRGEIAIMVNGREMYRGPNTPTSPGKELQEKLELDGMAGVYGPIILTGPEIAQVREILAEVHQESGLQQLLNQRAVLAHRLAEAESALHREPTEEPRNRQSKQRRETRSRVEEKRKELDQFLALHPQVVQRVSELREDLARRMEQD